MIKSQPRSTSLRSLPTSANQLPILAEAIRHLPGWRSSSPIAMVTRDETLLDAMLAHPLLINRPFVVTDQGTRLCRPSEVVLQIIPPLPAPFVKEDGEVVGG